ncbi:hypothetical protein VTL71DRAFT_2953 [Oculimacula yallundae]|uniref:Uncharacterized protein n=1 Tax=Oculimacula yallundae TaxID=86028 RepID=A0ABR4C7M4_9HELO
MRRATLTIKSFITLLLLFLCCYCIFPIGVKAAPGKAFGHKLNHLHPLTQTHTHTHTLTNSRISSQTHNHIHRHQHRRHEYITRTVIFASQTLLPNKYKSRNRDRNVAQVQRRNEEQIDEGAGDTVIEMEVGHETRSQYTLTPDIIIVERVADRTINAVGGIGNTLEDSDEIPKRGERDIVEGGDEKSEMVDETEDHGKGNEAVDMPANAEDDVQKSSTADELDKNDDDDHKHGNSHIQGIQHKENDRDSDDNHQHQELKQDRNYNENDGVNETQKAIIGKLSGLYIQTSGPKCDRDDNVVILVGWMALVGVMGILAIVPAG